MCQMSVFVKEEETEKLLQENVTKMEILEKGVRLSSLFEGPSVMEGLVLDHIDFSAGKAVLHKQ